MKTIARSALVVLALTACLAWAVTGVAAEASALTGKWKWTVGRGDRTFDMTLTVKQEADKLTGTITGRNNTESPVQDLKFKDGEVSFKVTREWNGQKMVLTYKGKLEGDTIKGTVERDRDGEKTTQDWEAKRVKE
jgi:hypothetical protein